MYHVGYSNPNMYIDDFGMFSCEEHPHVVGGSKCVHIIVITALRPR